MKIISTIAMILISLNLQANSLTNQQLEKLNNPVVKVKNSTFYIKEYNSINFTKEILFDERSLDKVIIKTEAMMQKDIIHKEQFLAISSTFSEQIMQSIFMNPQYLNEIKSIELLVNKPMKSDLIIKMEFVKDGLNTIVTNGQREQKRFVPYGEMFHQRLR